MHHWIRAFYSTDVKIVRMRPLESAEVIFTARTYDITEVEVEAHFEILELMT